MGVKVKLVLVSGLRVRFWRAGGKGATLSAFGMIGGTNVGEMENVPQHLLFGDGTMHAWIQAEAMNVGLRAVYKISEPNVYDIVKSS